MKRLKTVVVLLAGIVSAPPVFAEKDVGSGISVSAKAACLITADTGIIIWAKNENDPMPMASTTKIMTALLALENLEACGDKEVEITDEMVRVEGTSMGLAAGDVVNLEALAKGMLLCSGNDAANAAAIAVGGQRDKFISLMNEKAKQIGALNTRFVTPSGLDGGDHHSTAYDMAVIGSYAMENETFASIASKKSDRVKFIKPDKTVSIRNHNKLLRLYDGCIGIKTGFTKAAGRCLVSCSQRGDVRLVAVTLNAPDDWNDHKVLYDYGFENVAPSKFDDRGFTASPSVTGGMEESFRAYCGSDFTRTLRKRDLNKVKRSVEVKESYDAPIRKGQVVGKIAYYLDGKEIGRNEILADSDVEAKPVKIGILKNISDFFKNLFS